MSVFASGDGCGVMHPDPAGRWPAEWTPRGRTKVRKLHRGVDASTSTLQAMGAATRDRLVEATIAIIDAKGEQAVKVRDIAARAGVTEPSIYHYFASRDGLIEEAQSARFLRDQVDVLEAFSKAVIACRSREEFVDLVRMAFANALQPARAHQRFTRINVLGSVSGRPNLVRRLAEQQRITNTMVGDALRIAQALGFVRPGLDCDVLAVWAVGMATGRSLIELDPDLVDGEAWNELAIEALLAATGNPPDALGGWAAPQH